MRKMRGRSAQKKEKGKEDVNVEFETHTPLKDKSGKAYLHCQNTCMAQDE